MAQQSTAPAAPQAAGPAIDEYERAALIWTFQRVASSGLERGQEIFMVRCWHCHNDYTANADPRPAPRLRESVKRMDEKALAARIRAGGLRMPAYTEATLNDRDLADLVTYLRAKCGTFPTGGGCFDEHNPPANPRYRAQ